MASSSGQDELFASFGAVAVGKKLDGAVVGAPDVVGAIELGTPGVVGATGVAALPRPPEKKLGAAKGRRPLQYSRRGTERDLNEPAEGAAAGPKLNGVDVGAAAAVVVTVVGALGNENDGANFNHL